MAKPPEFSKKSKKKVPPRTLEKNSSSKTASPKPGRGARQCAAQALCDIFEHKIALEPALARMPLYKDLAARDRAFARNIAATTIRNLGQIDAVLKPYISKPPTQYVRAVLRTASCQILFLDTPGHAAVGESVAIIKRARKRSDANAAGMVNAVLRKVADSGKARAAEVPARENLPRWLQASWKKHYGENNLDKIAKAFTASPPLDLSVKHNAKLWAEKIEAELLPTDTLRRGEIGNILDIEGFREGAWWVQDIAASLPVKVLIEHLGSINGKKTLDMCAAPGGKTLQLAAAGAEVTALDRSASRLARVTDNLDRCGLKARTIAADAVKFRGVKDHIYDIVLLDAPCSATGTLRRRPDVAWNKKPDDVKSLVKLQSELLDAAARQVKSGGLIVYCTCSLEPEEGEWQISRFLQKRPDFSLISLLNNHIGGLEMAKLPNGALRTLPHYLGEKGGMDGFYIAMLAYKA